MGMNEYIERLKKQENLTLAIGDIVRVKDEEEPCGLYVCKKVLPEGTESVLVGYWLYSNTRILIVDQIYVNHHCVKLVRE